MSAEDKELSETVQVQPGQRIGGKYLVEGLIATGGMGAVVKAHHEVLEQDVAIKLMRPEIAARPEFSQRFLREARAAAKIKSDYVARVTDVDVLDDGTPFMVMELLEGEDLSTILAREAPLPIERAVDYVLMALAGVAAAHEIGIVHRDIKPANLFVVGGARRVKVLDFGISKIVEGEGSAKLRAGATTGVNSLLGTPHYMSPEQCSSSKNVDARTDLWAMGLVLYEGLTGKYPFAGEVPHEIFAEILTATITEARDLREDLPPDLSRAVMRALERNKNQRYANAGEMIAALAPFASARVRAAVVDLGELELVAKKAAPSEQRPGVVRLDEQATVEAVPAGVRGETALAPAISMGTPAAPRPEHSGGTHASMAVESDGSAPAGRGQARLFAAGFAVAVAAVAAIVWVLGSTRGPEAQPAPASEAAPTTVAEPAKQRDDAPHIVPAAEAPPAAEPEKPAATTTAATPKPSPSSRPQAPKLPATPPHAAKPGARARDPLGSRD